MVETKTSEYWEDLSKKGKTENDISLEVEALMEKFSNADPSDLLNYDTEPYSISKEFLMKLDESLEEIFSKHPKIKFLKKNKKKFLIFSFL